MVSRLPVRSFCPCYMKCIMTLIVYYLAAAAQQMQTRQQQHQQSGIPASLQMFGAGGPTGSVPGAGLGPFAPPNDLMKVC